MFKLVLPVKPLWLNQPFGGNKKTYAQFGLAGHNGLDMLSLHGQPVYAAHEGIANYEVDSSQGHGVDIVSTQTYDLGNFGTAYVKTRYWHLCDPKKESKYASPIYGRKNVKVKAGDIIGYADSTGFSTGDHLHFGLKPQGKNSKGFYNLFPNNGYKGAIDPFPFLAETKPPEPPKLIQGATGAHVTRFQEVLKELGYFPANQALTAFYGQITASSYDKFRKATGFQITVDNSSTGGGTGVDSSGMSQTYIAAVVAILSGALPLLGIDVVNGDALNATITNLIAVFAGIWVIFRRLQDGDISWLGIRKR